MPQNVNFLENEENESQFQKSEPIESSFEEKKESLLILIAMGMGKEYLGEEVTIQKIHKMTKPAISKYYNRYQLINSKKIAAVIRERGIRLSIKMLSYFLPLTDQEKLVHDLENDILVNSELSNIIGFFILKGGRLIALASGLIHVGNHIAFEPAQMLVTHPNLEITNTVDNVLSTEKNC